MPAVPFTWSSCLPLLFPYLTATSSQRPPLTTSSTISPYYFSLFMLIFLHNLPPETVIYLFVYVLTAFSCLIRVCCKLHVETGPVFGSLVHPRR